MKPYVLELKIEGLPETANEIYSMPLRIRMRRKKYWKMLIWLLVSKKKPPKPIPRARLTLTRFSTTRPDPDGLTSSFKHVIDGLVEAGVLENDRHENIGFPYYGWEKAPIKQGHCRIRVEEVSEVEYLTKPDFKIPTPSPCPTCGRGPAQHEGEK